MNHNRYYFAATLSLFTITLLLALTNVLAWGTGGLLSPRVSANARSNVWWAPSMLSRDMRRSDFDVIVGGFGFVKEEFRRSLSSRGSEFDDIYDSNMTPKLGIDIGKMLDPLTQKEADELKAAATEIIHDAYAEGLDEIVKLRKRMEDDLELSRKSMEAKSEYNTKIESEKLLQKIDTITSNFLSKTEASRTQTKLAAAADSTSTTMGRGVEWGSWGTLENGAAVLMSATMTTESGRNLLLGSVESATSSSSLSMDDITNAAGVTNRIIVVADETQDPLSKQLLPKLFEQLKSLLPGLEMSLYKPTDTLPLGGNKAACVLLFLTSFTDKSAIVNGLDRLLRKTVSVGDGGIAQPPTQIVAISTVGTERFNKIPYSMQNLMSGGKFEKRRQMEESIVRIVRDRKVSPGLDFTICKLGELSVNKVEKFQFSPFDTIDGTIDVDTAATVVTQAIAFQPPARNATLNCVGKLPTVDDPIQLQSILDDYFIRLDGPEIYRTELIDFDPSRYYDALVQYIREWAMNLAQTGKGLTTPCRFSECSVQSNVVGLKEQDGVQLLFQPTNTGRKYLSKEEEKESKESKESSKSSATVASGQMNTIQEGGIEFRIEVTQRNTLQLRLKRCHYSPDAVVKELSEESILNRFKSCLDVWKKVHSNDVKTIDTVV